MHTSKLLHIAEKFSNVTDYDETQALSPADQDIIRHNIEKKEQSGDDVLFRDTERVPSTRKRGRRCAITLRRGTYTISFAQRKKRSGRGTNF